MVLRLLLLLLLLLLLVLVLLALVAWFAGPRRDGENLIVCLDQRVHERGPVAWSQVVVEREALLAHRSLLLGRVVIRYIAALHRLRALVLHPIWQGALGHNLQDVVHLF